MNRFLKRLEDFFKYEFPHLPFAIIALLAASIWKGSAAAALGAVVLVIFHSERWAVERFFQTLEKPFQKPASNPEADDAKFKVLVESLNKAHAANKIFDDRIGVISDEIGKMKLRFAIRPVDENNPVGSIFDR